MTVRWNDGAWPIVRIEFRGALAPEDIDAYHRVWSALMERALSTGERFVVVGDALDSAAPGSEARKLFAEFVDQNHALIKRTTVGTFWALSSPLQRAALAVVMWIAPLPIPFGAFASVEETERAGGDALLRDRATRDERIDRPGPPTKGLS